MTSAVSIRNWRILDVDALPGRAFQNARKPIVTRIFGLSEMAYCGVVVSFNAFAWMTRIPYWVTEAWTRMKPLKIVEEQNPFALLCPFQFPNQMTTSEQEDFQVATKYAQEPLDVEGEEVADVERPIQVLKGGGLVVVRVPTQGGNETTQQ